MTIYPYKRKNENLLGHLERFWDSWKSNGRYTTNQEIVYECIKIILENHDITEEEKQKMEQVSQRLLSQLKNRPSK